MLVDLDAYTAEHGVKIGLRTDGSTESGLSINAMGKSVRISVKADAAARSARTRRMSYWP